MNEHDTTMWLREGLVRVCMCCNPGDSILEQNPHWQGLGLRVSHGYCPTCFERILAENGVEKAPKVSA